MQKEKTTVWPWVLGVLLVGGVAVLLLRDRFSSGSESAPAAPSPVAAAPAQALPAAAAEGAPEAAAAIQHPLDTRLQADPALPALADSDAPALQALGALFPGDALLAPLLRDFVIARLVGHINLLDRSSVPPTALAARPLAGELQVEQRADGVEDAQQIAAGNAARYAPFVAAFTAADADAVANSYRRFYPLVQQAYADLGHPDAYFNDRLVAVIDHLLASPEPARPLAVVRDERGRYRFVDPALQSRSVGQKLLLRMDAAQAAAVKRQLRAIRAAITRG